jgi:hypothetical protein
MRDIPVMLNGYKLTVVEPPMPKVREDGTVITNREGVTQFVVSLFAKLRVPPGQRAPKGEEIKVTLEADPGPGFEEDERVELVNARLNAYQLDTPDGRTVAGISFKAVALTPVGGPARHSGGSEK